MVTLPARQDPLVGQTLGHYQVLEKIGAGGMGEVYRARDQHLDREVAIKVLPQGILALEASRKRFRKEALALSRLEHPNIATIHDFDEQQGIDFLVMEYIPGVTLSGKVAHRTLSEKEVVALGVQLADGLAAAHDRGVIHRDLKPANVKLTIDGRLKILDFGLAKLRPSSTVAATTETLASGQAMAGTLPYMAPEQVLCGEIDQRTDIYGVGAILYEMATGSRLVPDLDQAQTIAAILQRPPQPPSTLNPAISPELERIISKCLEKDPETRYQSATDLAVDLRRMAAPSTTRPVSAPTSRSFWKWKTSTAAIFAITALLITVAVLLRSRQTQALKETDTIVLADFVNTTGDPVFDDALKQALTVQLEQSPFLSILPGKKIRDTLRLMAHAPDDRLTPELGRDLCQRAGGKAVLWGSIAPLGTQYVVGLTAAECASGRYVAAAQVQAEKKEEVLKALGSAVSSLRSKLGESLSSVQKFDTPVEEATTSSLEALKAYSLALEAENEKGYLDAIPFFERALELDPNFAMADAGLAVAQGNLGRYRLMGAAIEKAFALRNRVSERERFRISATYYSAALGDLQRSIQTYQLWAKTYPSDIIPHDNLGARFSELGRYQECVAENQEALHLNPDESIAYVNLATCELALNRPDVAEATITEAMRHRIDGYWLREPLYETAFFRGDRRRMESLLAESAGKNDEQALLSDQSNTEAYYGRLQHARSISRMVESKLRMDSPQAASVELAFAALREAEFGSMTFARQLLSAAIAAPNRGWRVAAPAALALARVGDAAQARTMAQEMEKDNPSNMYLHAYWLPAINAAIELDRRDPARAITFLEEAVPYELGTPKPLTNLGRLYPAYLRGQAYLMLRDGTKAAAEFQKYLDHRGIVLNYPLGTLAHLQLGRAYSISGNTTKAKAAYQDFLTLWKDADPDIPILKEAKAEYVKLQ